MLKSAFLRQIAPASFIQILAVYSPRFCRFRQLWPRQQGPKSIGWQNSRLERARLRQDERQGEATNRG